MKKLLIIAASISIFVSCGSKPNNDTSSEQEVMKYTLKIDNIKGQVKSYEESFQNVSFDDEFNIAEDSSAEQSQSYSVRYFDEKGVWIESKVFMQGTLFSNAIAQFSEEGAYIGTINLNEAGDTASQTKVIEFTSKKLVEENILDGEVVYRRTKVFDNLKTMSMVVDNMINENTLHSEFSYSYNEDGFISSYSTKTTQNGEEISASEQNIKYLEFDNEGNWTKRLSYSEGVFEGQLTIRTFEYYK